MSKKQKSKKMQTSCQSAICNCKVKTTALTIGLFAGIILALITILSYYTGYAEEFLQSIISVFPGYSITLPGSLFAFIYGFLDGFIGTYLFVWVWRFINKKMK
jgi:hypothetical protein